MSTIINDLISYLQCGQAIALNDAIHISSVDGKIYKYDPTDATQVFAGIAKEAGVLNAFVRVVQSGRVKGFTGLTAGQFVYASVTVPGGFQLAEPVPSQKIILGIAKSATELTINGALGIKPGGEGGSGGGLDVFYTETMEGLADTSDFSTGNNALFMGGGTMQGSLVVESSLPISGAKSLKYTQAAGSLNDYFASDLIDMDEKQRLNAAGMILYFNYDGNDNDGRFVVYDVTNGGEIASEVAFVKLASKATRYALSFNVPESCTQIRWGYKVLVENIGKILIIDDVEMSTNPFQIVDLDNITPWVNAGPISLGAVTTPPTKGTVITDTVRYRQVGESYEVEYTYYQTAIGTAGSGEYRFNLPAGVVMDPSVLVSANADSAGNLPGTAVSNIGSGVIASANTNRGVLNAFAVTNTSFRMRADYNDTAMIMMQSGTGLTFAQTELAFKITLRFKGRGLSAASPTILLANETFSTDTAPLTYAGSAQHTLATLANAPIGTFITFTYAANTNTRTQTTTAPTQTTASMNVNGIQIFPRAYNVASTATQPSTIAIQIGKGLKGKSLDLYKSAGKVTGGSLDWGTQDADVNRRGLQVKDYNELTGIIILDAGYNSSANTTSANFVFSDTTSQTNGYLVINASKSPALSGVPHPKRYVIATYSVGTAWYEVCNDGWVSQGSRFTNTAAGRKTVTFLVPMRDTNYAPSQTHLNATLASGAALFDVSINDLTTTSVTIYSDSNAPTKQWTVTGYGNSAAVKALGANPNY